MGVPLSSFTIFQRLVVERPGAWLKQVLEPFRLFTLIITDAQQPSDFDRVVAHNFSHWHHASGNKQLFFALTDPKVAETVYRQQARVTQSATGPQEFYRALEGMGHTAPLTLGEDMAFLLGIPRAQLPCVVLLPSLNSKEMVWWPAHSDTLAAQLIALGQLAEQLPSSETNRQAVWWDILEQHLLPWEAQPQPLAQPFSAIMADITAAMVPANQSEIDPQHFQQQRWQAVQTQIDITPTVLETSSELERSLLPVLSLLAGFKSNPWHDSHLLEHETRRFLRQAQQMEQFFASSPEGETPWGLLGILIGAAFEWELQRSLMHWMRDVAGVELPAYYMRYQPGYRAMVPHEGPNAIHLNLQGADNSWRAPTLGQAQLALSLIEREWNVIPGGLDTVWDDLHRHWKQITDLRNRCAHAMPTVQRADYRCLHDELRAFFKPQVLQVLADMKSYYRGEAPGLQVA